MAQQNSYVINGQLTFIGSLSQQVALQAQPIAGNLTFQLPNELPIANQVVAAVSILGNTVTLGFANAGGGSISTSQLSSVEGTGGKVQLTTGVAASPVT